MANRVEPPLARLDDGQLFRRYRSHGETQARDELVKRHLWLARALARRYSSGSAPDEDLLQVACYGLLRAVDRFDPAFGNRFTTFAYPTILGELRHHFRDNSWSISVPRGLKETVFRVSRAADELSTGLGRSPTASELALHLGIAVEGVLAALEARSARHAHQLDAFASADGDDYSVSDKLGAEDPELGKVEDRAVVARALRALGTREREIVRLRFCEELTHAQIAERVGISQMHVSRLLGRALDRLHTVATAQSSAVPTERAA